MGYDLHLVRVSGGQEVPIPLEEWLAALESLEAVRQMEDDDVVTNPNTGEVITFPRSPGDTEIFLPDDGEWIKAIRFSDGWPNLRHPDQWPGDESGVKSIWRAVDLICRHMGLFAIGDSGERYDPETGEVIRE